MRMVRAAAWILAILGPALAGAVTVERWKTHELAFTASTSPANPFDTYLLKIRLTRPDGSFFTVEGFHDGDGNGGPSGRVWKVRITPGVIGTWSWTTVTGDAATNWTGPGCSGGSCSGTLEVVSSTDPGPVVVRGRHFAWAGSSVLYPFGNFLDETPSTAARKFTHVHMSEEIADADRAAQLDQHGNVWKANKAAIYYANQGDYGGISTTPWVVSGGSVDRTRMDLAKWKLYDRYLEDWRGRKILAQMWFFADDSGFGSIPAADRDRLIRYAMARHSAFGHTVFVLALEWNEGFSESEIDRLGAFMDSKNPWGRLLSVHQGPGCRRDFGASAWVDFTASQPGNESSADAVNACALSRRSADTRPHLAEEFGHFASGDPLGQQKTWANFLGGAAGQGTGAGLANLARFLDQTGIPFDRMSGNNGLISGGTTNGYALSGSGHSAFYKKAGRSGLTITVSGSGLQGRWWDPDSSSAVLGKPFPVPSGTSTHTAPSTGDWVLWVTADPDGKVETLRIYPETSSFSPDPPPPPPPPAKGGARAVDVKARGVTIR